MQPIHFIALILAAGLVYSLLRIGIKAVAKDRLYQFAEGRAIGRVEHLAEQKAQQVTDLATLQDISTTLRAANQTWQRMPGTEPYRARVTSQLIALSEIAARIRQQQPNEARNTETVDQEKAA